MKCIFQNEDVCVVDDVLSVKELNSVWEGSQTENYSSVFSGQWHKVWRVTSGYPLRGAAHNGGDNSYLQPVYNAFTGLVKQYPKYFTKSSGMSLSVYVYGPGSKLSWHSDRGYQGAITLYIHPKWGASWGGELMLANTKERKTCQLRLDHAWEDEYLLAEGNGLYFAPKPNRAIIQKPGIWHGMNRVDQDAGDNLRVSVQGFWLA